MTMRLANFSLSFHVQSNNHMSDVVLGALSDKIERQLEDFIEALATTTSTEDIKVTACLGYEIDHNDAR